MKAKWTAALAAVLFVLAVLAVSPVGNSARQLLVPNADKVDGIHASRTPHAGALLPLGKNGKFPASIVPKVTGPRGPAGPEGAPGTTGAAGPQGLTGLRGETGPQGPAGAQGPRGYEGEEGAAGPQGPSGPTGPEGAKGDPGAGVKITGSVATWANLPASGDAAGDAYIVRDTGHLAVWDGIEFVDSGPIQGPPGGLSGYQIVPGASVPITYDDDYVAGTATCPAGKVAIGGGARLAADYQTGIRMTQSYPTVSGDSYGWRVVVANNWYELSTLYPYAICATEAESA